MFKGVRSLAVYATDKERAKEFYTGILGFEVAFDLGPELCFLKSRNGKIDIYLQGGMKSGGADGHAARLGFYLEAEGTAAECHAALKAAGVKLRETAPEQVDDDTACFAFEDPDGNIIEVSGRR